ncbi:recombinase family protein [Tissierella pigra]|nr:recombinase family protein [Tissierella pigra]
MKDKILNVALYCRLSKEDGDSEASDSIENQKDALTRYANEQNWNIYDIYIDDGYTGLNMERPNFQRLIRDIEDGYINVILVKNQSRISRDNAEVDIFLNKYLIERNVRCIGIIDKLDNMDRTTKKSSQINGLVNEWYSEDISNNVRLAQDSLRLQGKFIGSHSPYGYIKDPEDKHHLLVDENVRDIIVKIYDLYLDGYGYVKIAKTLNEKNIPCPAEYKEIFNYNREKIKKSQWSYHTVRTILKNEVYAGHMVQKKTTSLSYKTNKRVDIPEDKQIRVLNTHEAIIPQSKFNLVQDMMSKNIYTKPTGGGKKKHILAGLMYCRDCGRAMRYRNDSKTFNCNTYIVYGGEACTPHKIRLDDVLEIVLEEIQSISRLYVEVKRLKSDYDKVMNTKSKRDNTNIRLSVEQKRFNEVETLQKKLVENFLLGKIDDDIYNKMLDDYRKEKEELSKKIEQLRKEREELQSIITQHNDWSSVFEKYVNIKELDRTIINELIDRIDVSEDEEGELSIYINFKHKNPFMDDINMYKDYISVG